MPGTLGVDIIGWGFGESIVLRMPHGKVGVIDCCSPVLNASDSASRRRANPTLRYVRDRLNAERLAFLAFSHPHEDHGRGLSHLLHEYKDHIDEIWIFQGFQSMWLERYFGALFDRRRKLPIEELLQEEPGTFSKELLTIRNLVIKQIAIRNPRRAFPRVFCGQQDWVVEGEDVRVRVLGPSVALVQAYEASLVDNLARVVDGVGAVNQQWKPHTVNHNLASPALLITFGETRLVLGGDVERDGWREVLRECDASGGSLSSHFVKISHHGSATGYIDGLYERFGQQGLPIAVLTPFTRHKRPLPRREALDHLRPRVEELWATSIANARRSMEDVEPLSVVEIVRLRPILQRWQAQAGERPEWRAALAPGTVLSGGEEILDAASEVPQPWIADLAVEPRLIALIHPDLRCRSRALAEREEPVEDVYRLSFAFGKNGREIKEARYVGKGCGQLD